MRITETQVGSSSSTQLGETDNIHPIAIQWFSAPEIGRYLALDIYTVNGFQLKHVKSLACAIISKFNGRKSFQLDPLLYIVAREI